MSLDLNLGTPGSLFKTGRVAPATRSGVLCAPTWRKAPSTKWLNFAVPCHSKN